MPVITRLPTFFEFNLKGNTDLSNALEKIYQDKNGDWSAIRAELTADKGFTPELVKSLTFTHELANLNEGNQALVTAFQNDQTTHSLYDIALTLSKHAFVARVENTVPDRDDKTVFANGLYTKLFRQEPTAVLVNMIKNPLVPLLNNGVGGQVATVLQQQPAFNIKTQSVYELLRQADVLKDVPTDDQPRVISQLKTLQRIAAVSPTPDAVPALYEKKISTAFQIAEIPKSQFLAYMQDSGVDADTLGQVHANAVAARVRNEQALMALRETGKGTGVAFIDQSLATTNAVAAPGIAGAVALLLPAAAAQNATAQETLAANNLSWDLVFGDADLCACDECTAVYSAASYFVELLQYLRNNNLDPNAPAPVAIKADPKDISGTPLQKLFDRRPDLGCLELTCANTNTILPYVDLVNEVMENYVAFKHLKPFNVADETSGELLAEPQHTEYQAYCILKNEVYPFTLPYHQPIDAARIYLDYLGTSRHEVVDTFRKSNKGDDAQLTQLQGEALQRAADAEFLGMTLEEYVILTKESFESKTLADKRLNRIQTDAEYETTVGVKPVWAYYGYDTEANMLAYDGIARLKKEFLRRTGIDYFDVVELLKTEYANPNVPKGRTKAILESLRFSYRFLQHYADLNGLDKLAEDLVKTEKLADLFPALKEAVGMLTNRRQDGTLSCPNPSQESTCIGDKELTRWVKCHFRNVGKMIVIESGRACVNGQVVWKQEGQQRPLILIRNCELFRSRLTAAGANKIGDVDKETGKLTFLDPAATFTAEQTKNLVFVGDKGERGVFAVVNNELYLLILEQKDTCDLSTARLQHLDGTPLTLDEYDQIHRFLRLWRKMGWTIDETDKAITGLGKAPALPAPIVAPTQENECGCADGCDDCADENAPRGTYALSPALLHQLVSVRKLLDKTGIELIKLLTFWTPISTAGEKSLYQRLFLTHNVVSLDAVFKASNMGNYLIDDAKLSDHTPVVMAALNLTADDIDTIRQSVGMPDALTLANLSTLYRYRLLAKAMGLRIPAFTTILPLFGPIFQDAQTSWEFLDRWDKVADAGFTYQQLNYLIRGVDDTKKPFTPSQKTVLQLAKILFDGLNALDEAHPDISADATLTDPALQQVNIQEKTTSEVIRAKASLLFEAAAVEKIVGFLEGTLTFITNAPKNLTFALANEKTLTKKLRYNKTDGTVQLTGILTDAEKVDYLALSNDPAWSAALTRLEKQQAKQYKELLGGIVDSEKAKSAERKAQVEASETLIKRGDITMPVADIPNGQADTNTAPQKRVAFLAIFLPYLRQELTHRFVGDTLANSVGLERTTTDVLISEILLSGAPPTPIYGIFENLKTSALPAETNWNGYLIPSAAASYTFIVRKSDAKPVVTVDGEALDFTVQEDPTDEWWSADLKLIAGKLYKLTTAGVPLKNLYWKTTASAIALVPASALIPDFASAACAPALTALKKAAMLVTTFDLSADEIRFLATNQADFDALNFNSLTLQHWLRLEAYTRLRNVLPTTQTNILDFWNWTRNATSNGAGLGQKITDLTTWKKERVDKLIAPTHFNIGTLTDFRNETNLLKLQKALAVADKIGMDIDLLFDWAVPTSKFKICRTIADSIRDAIRARYNQTDWEQVVKPLEDKLRNNQKDALIAYLLQRSELIAWGVTDADGLFEYFLIDVQMDACMETSRIKQAISSVQLFVQRCLLGLEEAFSQIMPSALDRDRWEWMQRYRVWEANRKVFLYPENWIESNLRDDKSAFFKELESELLQKDINKQNVQDALKAYLYKVDEVANMEVVGLYLENATYDNGLVNKLHVFARTRNAPYFFYYRYFDQLEKNWYPWEKMQIDIPSYDVEDETTGMITGNGCYLTPVVWNGRLLIFIPQVSKKTKPNPTANVLPAKPDGGGNVTVAAPVNYYEIKMGWSEYRNGKWTQKLLSKDSVATNPIDATHHIEFLKFVPQVSDNAVLINVDDLKDSDGGFLKTFRFEGSALSLNDTTHVTTDSIPIDFFNRNNTSRLFSWQIDADGKRQITDIFFDDLSSDTQIQLPDAAYHNFKLSYTHDLLSKINTGPLDKFFGYNLSSIPNGDKADAFGAFDNDGSVATPNIYHELKRPYSLYNWELFFHTPTLLADALSKAQQFEEAMKWYHFVFNPVADGNEPNRFWQFAPFKELSSQRILDSIFNNLKPNTADQAITEWRNKPFMPHLVARSRPVAYMKWAVMKYLDNLLAWGDYLFRQDTIESINQATQLYVLAGHILGPKPMTIPKRGKIKPQTYIGLLDKWDAFGNAMVELELAAPFSQQIDQPVGMVSGELAFANIFGLASTLYFCIPSNPKLTGYWDTLADRLFKIRHCQNIEGVFRMLPLFEPPVDPALLVKAAASGLSIASVLNDLNTPMPNYRFYYLLQKALEICSELKSLGGGLLSAFEKIDNEALTLLRARHETGMQTLVMEVRKLQLDEAQKSLETLNQSRLTPEHRMRYYLQLIGEDVAKVPGADSDFSELPNSIATIDGDSGLKLISFEKEDMDKASEAQDFQRNSGILEALAGILHIIPSISVDGKPFGVGMGSVVFAGTMLANAAQAVGKGLQVRAGDLTFSSARASKKGSFTRVLQERIFQVNSAGHEIKQIDKQLVAQAVRIQITNQEIVNQQKQIDNAQEIEEFLKDKYTSNELYSWMRGSLKTLYHQSYNLAYDLAKKAEKVYRFERGLSSTNFVQAGYWDAGQEGLLAGEQLYVGLKQLEVAYQSERGYDYEITKHVSLRQIDPLALLQFRESGTCEFALPEVLFDRDYPGHYKRRIKSVSITIPGVIGPYTGINATLRLLTNKFRNTAIGGKAYAENTEETDDRFNTFIIPISAIAASGAQNDGGMFELNFKDERYLPFEGAGLISKWRLELPTFRQFDYRTISDAIMHVRYTAAEGGERLKKAASDGVQQFTKSVEDLARNEGLFTLIDLPHDLATDWYKAITTPNAAGELVMDLAKAEQFLPYYVIGNKKALKLTDAILITDSPAGGFSLNETAFSDSVKVGSLKSYTLSEPPLPMVGWQLTLPASAKNSEQLFLAIRLSLV